MLGARRCPAGTSCWRDFGAPLLSLPLIMAIAGAKTASGNMGISHRRTLEVPLLMRVRGCSGCLMMLGPTLSDGYHSGPGDPPGQDASASRGIAQHQCGWPLTARGIDGLRQCLRLSLHGSLAIRFQGVAPVRFGRLQLQALMAS